MHELAGRVVAGEVRAAAQGGCAAELVDAAPAVEDPAPATRPQHEVACDVEAGEVGAGREGRGEPERVRAAEPVEGVAAGARRQQLHVAGDVPSRPDRPRTELGRAAGRIDHPKRLITATFARPGHRRVRAHLVRTPAEDPRRDRRPDRGQQRVQVVTGTVGDPRVTVADDVRQRVGRPRGPAVGAADRRVVDEPGRVDAVPVELPREEPLERVDRGRRDRARLEVADERDADRRGVHPGRVRSAHRLPRAEVPALEDLAVPVDEEVVVRVAVLQRLGRVAVQPAHDRRRVTGAVVVVATGVVHDGDLHVRRRVGRLGTVRESAGSRPRATRPAR